MQRQLLDLISGSVAEAGRARYDKTFLPRNWPAIASTPSPRLATLHPAIDRLLDLVWTGITSTRSTQSVRRSASQPD